MSFDWSEYLNLARRLAGTPENPANEAELRSAISRAYYAAFIQARNFLRDRDNLKIPRKNTHEYVINLFRDNSDKVRKKIGERLRRLRDFRNEADYEDRAIKLAPNSKESLTLARRIISGLGSL